MKIIVIQSQDNGVFYNNQRQSTDININIDIAKKVKSANANLHLSAYSKSLFENFPDLSIKLIDEDTDVTSIAKNDYVLIEDLNPQEYIKNASGLIVYTFDKAYPADRFFNYELIKTQFSSIKTDSFSGFSHNKINVEIFEK